MTATDEPDDIVRRCDEAQAAVKAHEAAPAIDEEWQTWEAELRRLAGERDRLCAAADLVAGPRGPAE